MEGLKGLVSSEQILNGWISLVATIGHESTLNNFKFRCHNEEGDYKRSSILTREFQLTDRI